MEPCAWYNAGSQSVLIEYHMNSKKQNQKTTWTKWKKPVFKERVIAAQSLSSSCDPVI